MKNAIHTLPQAMDSVISQQTDEIEYIVIDGGSMDGSAAFIESRADHLAYWCSEVDGGISQAFNKGIRKSRGQFIGILSADDYYEAGSLHRLREFLKERSITDGVVYGAVRYLDETVASAFVRQPDLRPIKRYMSVFHPAMFVSAKTYYDVGLYDETYKFAMDCEWVHRALKRGTAFHRIQDTLTSVRLHGTSHYNLTRSLREFNRSCNIHFGGRIRNAYYLARQYALHSFLKHGGLRIWLRLRHRF